jgi:hypothetical protein
VGAPSRIGIATHGYRRGDSNPGKVCIATHGYRCLEPDIVVDDPFGGGMGHGAVILDQIEQRKDLPVDPKYIALAIIAIEEMNE